jgi:hypothetical protein
MCLFAQLLDKNLLTTKDPSAKDLVVPFIRTSSGKLSKIALSSTSLILIPAIYIRSVKLASLLQRSDGDRRASWYARLISDRRDDHRCAEANNNDQGAHADLRKKSDRERIDGTSSDYDTRDVLTNG